MSPRSKPGIKERETERRSAEDRASRDAELRSSSGTLSSFEGPIEQSPYYKNLLSLGTEATSREFDNMLTAIRSRGLGMGMDYTQPISGAAAATLEQERASELARIPREAYLEATGPAMQAAGMRTQRAGLFSDDSMQNMNLSADLENQRRNRRAALWSNMVNAGARIASSFAPGRD